MLFKIQRTLVTFSLILVLKLRVADVNKTFDKWRKIGEIKILIQTIWLLKCSRAYFPFLNSWKKKDKVQKPHRNEILRESLYEKKHPSYSPVNWVPHSFTWEVPICPSLQEWISVFLTQIISRWQKNNDVKVV